MGEEETGGLHLNIQLHSGEAVENATSKMVSFFLNIYEELEKMKKK